MNAAGRLALPDLRLAEYHFELMLRQAGSLPRHPGATLRGGIALLLKQAVCVHPELKYCRDCDLRSQCVYPALFEPAPPPGSEVLKTHQDVPLPFVLRLPTHWQAQYAAGDRLSFGAVIVGDPLRFAPYVVAAVEHLGRTGLGQERLQFRLARVTASRPDHGDALPVYEAGLMYHTQAAFDVQALGGDEDASRLTLRFLTPTRLKHADRLVEAAPPFHVVIRALLRRVSSLSYFYGGQRWEIDYRGWIARAEGVQISQADVQWTDWERFSTRQQRAMNLGGIVGEASYTGEVDPFLPLLRLGELVHVGKAAVFGNGRFEIGE